jgi:hypothetical protein
VALRKRGVGSTNDADNFACKAARVGRAPLGEIVPGARPIAFRE